MNVKVNNCLSGKENNFDFIRFFASLAVIFSHSYNLTLSVREPVELFSNNKWSIGGLSVATFFIISGLLITRSYHRSKSIFEYVSARTLRIYPALIAVTLCTVFIFGPLLTTRSLHDYFTNGITAKYLITMTALRIERKLPGVFEHNHFANCVNGSLWTLPHEVMCYCLVVIVGMLVKRKFKHFFILSVLVALLFNNFLFFDAKFYKDAYYFLCGSLFYIYRDKIKLNSVTALIALILFILNLHYNRNGFSNVLIGGATLSYVIIFISFIPTNYLKNFAKSGDYSYGVYIWGFLVQQIVALKFIHLNHYYNFLISAFISFILAMLSWHFIEKKALLFKKRLVLNNQHKTTSSEMALNSNSGLYKSTYNRIRTSLKANI